MAETFVIFGQWWQMAAWQQSTVKERALETWPFVGTGANATLRQEFGVKRSREVCGEKR